QRCVSVLQCRRQLRSMPQVVIADSRLMGHGKLRTGDVVFIAVDDRPQRTRAIGKTAGEYAGLQYPRVWFPVRTVQIVGHGPLDAGDSLQCLRIMRRVAVPEPPEIF